MAKKTITELEKIAQLRAQRERKLNERWGAVSPVISKEEAEKIWRDAELEELPSEDAIEPPEVLRLTRLVIARAAASSRHIVSRGP